MIENSYILAILVEIYFYIDSSSMLIESLLKMSMECLND